MLATGLELLTSGDLPASASQSAGITGVSYHAQPSSTLFYTRTLFSPKSRPSGSGSSDIQREFSHNRALPPEAKEYQDAQSTLLPQKVFSQMGNAHTSQTHAMPGGKALEDREDDIHINGTWDWVDLLIP
ncbi:hypothetical protein AAY473_021932 [Plecturocebus cupreus]